MPRTSKKKEAEEQQKAPEVNTASEEKTEVKAEAEEQQKAPEVDVPANVDKLMQLYPQYEQIYVTKDGFVHPYGVPQYLVADATLYTNKYYNNK